MPKIEIDLADLGLPTGLDHEGEPTGGKTLQDLIVDAAVDRLIGHDYELQRELRSDISTAFRAKTQERVESLIEEAFAAPIQRTTPWGETRGEETTVREIIRETIEKYLKSTTPTRDGYGRDAQSLTQLIANEVQHILNKDMKDHITKVKGEVKLEVQKKALAAAVAELTK